MERSRRLAHELVRQTAALEGFDIHKDPRMENVHEESTVNKYYDPKAIELYQERNEVRKKHYRVVTLQKTREKLEKWFEARDIPIRIIYGEEDQIRPISKKGVITYRYQFSEKQEPPTAWMIVHNLGHAIFEIDVKWGHSSLSDTMIEMVREMGLWFNREREVGSWKHTKIYPTTRSEQIGKIGNTYEAFYEIFAQWVSTGHVKLDGPDPVVVRKWETELETFFQQTVDEIARLGTVVSNI